jgi:hypothetical protein
MTLREGVLESTDEKSFLVKNPTGFLTVTGTIKRGKNKGEVFDVQLKMNRDRLAKIEKEIQERESQCCCGLTRGLHVLLASILLVPFLWLFCTLYAFYMGTLTWYNVFIYYNEQRTCCHTVTYQIIYKLASSNGKDPALVGIPLNCPAAATTSKLPQLFKFLKYL